MPGFSVLKSFFDFSFVLFVSFVVACFSSFGRLIVSWYRSAYLR